MSKHAAGWFNDPYGRFQQRYWDGSDWTGDVATNGVQQADPMGASSVIPIVTPATAFEAPATDDATTQRFAVAADPDDPTAQAADPLPPASGNAVSRFLDTMGDDARLRSLPSLRVALSGIGGLMIAVGLLVVFSGDDPSRGKLVAVSLLLLAGALAARLLVKVAEVRAAAVGVAVVAIPTFAGAATVGDGRAEALTFFVAAALFLAAWALRGFLGRTLLLGLGLLALVGAFSSLIADIGQDKCQTYLEDEDYDSYYDECEDYQGDFLEPNLFLPVPVTDNLGDQGVTYLVFAALLLGSTWWLDRRGYHGAGTGTVVAGLISSVVGAALLADQFGDTGGPMMVTIVGLLVCIVGSHGARRATTWWGALLASLGAVALVALQWEPDSATSTGGVAIVTGLALIGIAFLGEPIRAAVAQSRADDAASPPTPPSPFDPPEA